MININFLRENPELFRDGIAKKNTDPNLIDRFLALDDEWRKLKRTIDDARAYQKNLGPDSREEARLIKEEIQKNDDRLSHIESERDTIISLIPNLPDASVPIGKDDSENQVIKESGSKPNFNFPVRDYVDVAKGLIDTERAARIAGSRFGYIFGDLAKLEFSLIQFAIDTLLPYGFKMTLPPVMIHSDVLRKMGKGKFIDAGDAFALTEDDLYLVGSSEQSIAPLYMGETLNASEFPMRFLGFSTCFRKEAGSYGKDTKGILRVHQFNKLEMFSITSPEKSKEEHEFLLARQEELMQKLNLHYRVVANCTGDMGFDAVKQYDVEAWIPSQDKYRETHSCSNTTDFQSRGLGITFKSKDESGKDKNEFVHTLNATAFSERPLLAILENYQTESGEVIVPEVLRKYFGSDKIVPK